ncbi:class II aldolase/adducin family protein [Arthrobacter sp. B1805]|uniref:class II aldolase/adducin family protein n=1 Tax=Arthrobacter sp. B1805 TaxID=2058892 RepID=UPI000CE442C5
MALVTLASESPTRTASSFPLAGATCPHSHQGLLRLGETGNVLAGEGRPPVEWPIHSSIYRSRPDVNAVLHSHSPMSKVFSLSSQPLQPVYGISAPWLSRDIPVCRLLGIVATEDAGAQVAAVLGDGPAVLLRAHGSVVVGSSVEDVTVRAVVLERAAAALQQMLAMGGVQHLTPEELTNWAETTPEGHQKTWEFLLEESRLLSKRVAREREWNQ